jgi:uncharacterized protein involved in exopolysaccharide biosynthesis
MGPAFAALVVSVIGAYLWPDTYRSTAALRVQSPVMPDSVMPTAVSSTLNERINSMASTIKSRTVLQTIISTYELYPSDVKRLPIEDVVEKMKKAIVISNVESVNVGAKTNVAAFQIAFDYVDRFKAQKVVQDLLGRFTSENQKEQTGSVFQGIQFFKDQSENARKDLEATETKLADFRTQYQGRLPDQVEADQQMMNAMQTRLQMVQSSMSRASQDQMLLQTNLSVEQEKRRGLKEYIDIPEGEKAKNEKLVDYDHEIQSLERVISVLKDQYTENFPDLKVARQRLATVKKERDALTKEETAKAAAGGTPGIRRRVDPEAVRMGAELDANIKRFQGQIEAKSVEIEDLNKEARQIHTSIQAMDAKIQSIPATERQYAELLRDRDLKKNQYAEQEIKLQKMLAGGQAEERKLGETLEQLDSPTLPMQPTEPKRPVIIAAGTVIGLFLGLVLAGAREVKDTSLKNLKDVRAYTKMVVLGSIPLLENDLVVRRRRRITWLGWTVAILVGIALMTASVVYYIATKA